MDTLKLKFMPLKVALPVLLTAIGLAGCASTSPVLDQHFGEAVNAAKAQQIINPDASQNTDPVAGVDGKAADAAMDRYHRSFVAPPPVTNVFTIGVGNGAGSTTGTSGGMSR